MDNKIKMRNFDTKKGLNETIFQETVDHLYKALPSSLLATFTIAAVLVSVLWQTVDRDILIIWLTIMAVICISRYILYIFYKHDDKNEIRTKQWDTLFFVLMVFTGIGWSVISIWLLPDNESIYHYLPALVLIGMSAGSVTTLSFRMRNTITYLFLVLFPLFVSEVLSATFMSYSVAGLTFVFTVFSLTNAKYFNQTVVENIKLRYVSTENEFELTESKNTAIEASRVKTDFISLVCMEVRTLLNAILGFSQLLKMSDSPKLNQEQDEQVQGVLDSGQGLLSLIDELMDLSKIETDKLNVSIEDVLVNDVLNESLAILSPFASKLQIEIINQIEDTYVVKADFTRLKQIFINLITNAIKYNDINGIVTISARVILENKVRFLIADTGEGLTTVQQAEIFRPFHRFNYKTGVGLELYITRSLVEIMGGNIGVESEYKKGSVFWFEFTLAEHN